MGARSYSAWLLHQQATSYSGDMSDVLVAVEIPLVGDERHKNWAKVVHAVDPSKASGWAYEGDFVAVGGIQDVPAGSVLLVYGERGSRANPVIEARVYRVNADATLSHRQAAKGRAWARTLRDTVVEMLDDDPIGASVRPWGPELMAFSDDALREELRRRGADE
jgi:hypothetical protein